MLDILTNVWTWVIAAVSVLLAVSATIHAVIRKRDGRAVIGWVGLIVLAPLVGAIAYFWFGVNRIQRKATALNVPRKSPVPLTVTPGEGTKGKDIAERHPGLVGLATLGDALLGHPILRGNAIEPLVNGDEAYPAMLEAIEGAERTVALLSYIFDNDRAGQAFLEALVRAKGRGVEVRVLIDHVGSRYSRPSMVDQLRKAGIPVATFLPTRKIAMMKYSNLRNHRKILVVDGSIGFTGGTNIREGHWLSLEPSSPVQCLHFRVLGPVVAHLQEAFALDWAFSTRKPLEGKAWFPDLKREGDVWARGIPDGPDENFEVLLDTLVGALSVAEERVWIVTPYFLPDSTLIHALNVAAMRGVEINILLPEENNLPLVEWACMAQLHQLIDKGCRVFLGPSPFDHTKIMVVDGAWSLIGSTNWDPRSLRLNFEYNVECYDEPLAEKIEAIVGCKAQAARVLTLEALKNAPFFVRLRNGLARLLTPYL